MKQGNPSAGNAGAVLLFAVACQSTPELPSDAGIATGTASSPAVAASSVAAPTSSASSAAARPASCDDLRKAVIAEAKQMAPCENDANCEVHRSVLCGIAELDCHAVHVHKDRNPEKLDAAIAAYAEQCPPSKCKCDVPAKSVCRDGMCAAR